MNKTSFAALAAFGLMVTTSLFSVAQAREVEIERHGNHVRPEHVERVEKVEKVERLEKAERPEKAERVEKVEKVERVEKAERPETEHGGPGHN